MAGRRPRGLRPHDPAGDDVRDICVAARHLDRPRRAAPGLYLCPGCRTALGAHVADLPYLHDQLGRILRRPSRPGVRVRGGTAGLYIDPRVADVRERIRGSLYGWARVVLEKRGLQPPAPAPSAQELTLHQAAAWLAPHLDWCAAHRWVDEMLGELGELVGRAWALIEPNRARIAELAPCPDCGHGALGAVIRAEGDLRPSLIFCDGCGIEYEPHQWRRLAKRLGRG